MKSRLLESVALGAVAATPIRKAGFWIASVKDSICLAILCCTAGGGGFGRAACARCTERGSTGLAELATAADRVGVALGCGLGGCGLVAGTVGVGATAVGAGSGAIFAGALTGGRSGPDPPANAGRLPLRELRSPQL